VAGVIDDLESQLDTDDISGQGHREKKYYIDTVNLKIPRKGMEMTGFLRDGMSEYCLWPLRICLLKHVVYKVQCLYYDLTSHFLYIADFLALFMLSFW